MPRRQSTPLDPVLGDVQGLVEKDVEGRDMWSASLGAAGWIAALPLLKAPAQLARSSCGVPPVIWTQRSTATST